MRKLVLLVALLLLPGCGHHQTPQEVRQLLSTANWYSGVEKLQGEALLAGLGQLTRRGTPLTYNQARDVLYGTVADLDGDDVITCVYTNRQGVGVHNRTTAEAVGFNTEHLWPQSLGAGGAPARSDLHHLFPVDERTNSRRSSLPFGEVRGTGQLFRPAVWGGRIGDNVQGIRVFEPPDEAKGLIARALFYFYVKYRQTASLTNFDVERRTLYQWHHRYPVTSEEVQRHEAVYRLQGNRNPFIDRPEFADALRLP